MATKRLIDANELVEDLEAAKANNGMGALVASTLIRYVKRCTTVDAVEVVRCKNCTESDPCDVSRNRVWCRRMGRYMKEDGYCSEGKADEALQQLP